MVILFNKYDLESAYKRIHVLLMYALQFITIMGRIAYLLLRLPFGTTPAAVRFCTISETVTDFAQKIAKDKTWNPTHLKSDLAHLIPEADQPEDLIPLQQKPFHLLIQPDLKNIHVDVYVDDIITTVLAPYKNI